MSNVLLALVVIVVGVVLVLQLLALLRGPGAALPALQASIQSQVTQSAERTERAMRDELARTREETGLVARQGREELAHPIAQMRQTVDHKLVELRDELQNNLQKFHRLVASHVEALGMGQKDQLARMQLDLGVLATSTEQKMDRLTTSNAQQLEGLRKTVETRLVTLQEDNGKQLEQMRITVDEKLHGTLEQRLGESFKQVSERLEQVHRGLGEMQALATGVGDLKKVLGNVKTRGTWGEVQLGALLSQVLSPSQYAENVSPQGNGERIEFVVKMPGQLASDDSVWLPIDAKFPLEDYRRLIDAHEACDRDAEDAASSQLATRIKQCAKDISQKYICPPRTTSFAILYLPSEGLFAEVVRNNALVDLVQQDYRVVLAGPTTLWSILSSLQMGFRTLAIQQRSNEVWKILGAIKSEWGKYGTALEKVQKKLEETTNAFGETSRRGRAIGRVLREVDELPGGDPRVTLLIERAVADAEPA